MHGRAIEIRGRALPYPAVCAPLVGRTHEALLEECAVVCARRPDVLEWRVDFFGALGDASRVVEAAQALRHMARDVPILFTRRHSREGGEKITAHEPEVLAAYRAVCEAGLVDLIDYEMDNDAGCVAELRELSQRTRVALVLSFHDFTRTPPFKELVARIVRAHELGADVAKVAVMPQSRDDVLALLAATSQASAQVPIPVITMAMGPLGAITRAGGWQFGSALTFAVGASASAPGQMPIDDLRTVVAALERAQ